MQQYSTTGGCSQGTLDFLHQLVERNLESVLAANQPELTPEPVKLAGADVEGLIVECSEQVRAMAWKFVRNASRLEFDDMYSVGMLAVCEAVPLLKEGLNPFPYLCRTAKYAMIHEYKRVYECSTDSLDVPLFSDSDMCLVDTLSDGSTSSVRASSKRERALHDALLRLPTRQRASVRRRAGLPGYGVHSLEETSQVVHCSPHGAHMLDYWGRHALARDAVLCEVVGVEVVK